MKSFTRVFVKCLMVFICICMLLINCNAVSAYKESVIGVINIESAFTGTKLIAEMNRISVNELAFVMDELARQVHKLKTVLKINIDSEFYSDEIEVHIPAFVFTMAFEKEIDEIELDNGMVLLALTPDAVDAAGYPDVRFEARKLYGFESLHQAGVHESTENEHGMEGYKRTESEYGTEVYERAESEYGTEVYERAESEYGTEVYERTESEYGTEVYERTEAVYSIEAFERIKAEYGMEAYERTEEEYGIEACDEIKAVYDMQLYMGNNRIESFNGPVEYYIPCQWEERVSGDDVKVLYLNDDGLFEEVEYIYHPVRKAVSFRDARTGVFVIKIG